MSDNWIQLIPTSPSFVPSKNDVTLAVARLEELLGGAEYVRAIDEGGIVFVDAGANFESVSCQLCNEAIDVDWWSQRVNEAHQDGYRSLSLDCPSCEQRTSLNDLTYCWPQGFSRWRIEARNAPAGRIEDRELRELEALLRTKLRAVHRHI